MNKRTFWKAMGLLTFCGAILTTAVIFTSRQQEKENFLLWSTKPQPFDESSLSFTPDGQRILYLHRGLQVWDARSGQILHNQAHYRMLWPREYPDYLSEDGRRLALNIYGPVRAVTGVVWEKETRTNKLAGDDDFTEEVATGRMLRRKVTEQFATNCFLRVRDVLSGRYISQLSIPDGKLGAPFVDRSYLYTADGSHILIIENTEQPVGKGYHNTVDGFHRKIHYGLWSVSQNRYVWNAEDKGDDCERHLPVTFQSPTHPVSIEMTRKASSFPGDYNTPQTNQLLLRDLRQGKTALFERPPGFPAETKGEEPEWEKACFSPDGKLLVAVYTVHTYPSSQGPGPHHNTLVCWSVATKKALWTLKKGEYEQKALRFSPDCRSLAIGQYDSNSGAANYAQKGKLWLVDASTGNIRQDFHDDTMSDQFQQQWQRTSANFTARLPFVGSRPSRTMQYFSGDSGPVEAVAFSPNGKTLAAAYHDGSLKLWRIPQQQNAQASRSK